MAKGALGDSKAHGEQGRLLVHAPHTHVRWAPKAVRTAGGSTERAMRLLGVVRAAQVRSARENE